MNQRTHTQLSKMSFFERVSGGNPFSTQVGQLIGKYIIARNIFHMLFYSRSDLSKINVLLTCLGRGCNNYP